MAMSTKLSAGSVFPSLPAAIVGAATRSAARSHEGSARTIDTSPLAVRARVFDAYGTLFDFACPPGTCHADESQRELESEAPRFKCVTWVRADTKGKDKQCCLPRGPAQNWRERTQKFATSVILANTKP